jgi:NAD(P)-dependent dehydrogenase (short-subunit alcohol dehydrogenase family)
VVWVCQAVLPHLARATQRPHRQISTVGAVGSMPTFGMYNASKWALEGFSEAPAAEVAPGGVRVTIAELGGFATDCAWSSMRFAIPLPDYDPLLADVTAGSG